VEIRLDWERIEARKIGLIRWIEERWWHFARYYSELATVTPGLLGFVASMATASEGVIWLSALSNQRPWLFFKGTVESTMPPKPVRSLQS